MSKKKPRTRAGGKLTEAGLRGRFISALRRLSQYWEPKNIAKRSAREGRIRNPSTDRLVMGCRCAKCNGHIMEKDSVVDHINPVVPTKGFDKKGFLGYDWNVYLENMFVEADGFQVLCKPCHLLKSNCENEERRNGR